GPEDDAYRQVCLTCARVGVGTPVGSVLRCHGRLHLGRGISHSRFYRGRPPETSGGAAMARLRHDSCPGGEHPMELHRLIAALSDPAAYPEPAGAVEVRQTHISVVFLAGARAYKVKKPVHLDFLDYSTL